MPPDAQPVPVISPPSVDVFRHRYVRQKRPVVIRGLMDDWPAMKRWSVDYFRERFGERSVPVARATGPLGFFDPKRGVDYRPMRVADYLDGLQADDPTTRYMLFPVHQALPELLDDVQRPEYCRDAPWFRSRFWFAAPDTRGPLHRDLPENLYAQVSGRKRFVLVDWESKGLVSAHAPWSGVPNYARVDAEQPDHARFPRFARALRHVAELEPGDVLYIPSLVWHQARSRDLSISINLWWANGALAALVRGAELFQRVRGLSL
jgi:hypothetical protein